MKVRKLKTVFCSRVWAPFVHKGHGRIVPICRPCVGRKYP